jgi:predicted nucleic acid-binding protein
MADRLLVDTDVLIDYLRGQPDAVNYLEPLTEPLLMSAVTLAELYAGVRDGQERRELDAFVLAFELVAVDRDIALKGGLYRRDYRKSHNVGLPDALIAATAEIKQATLVTLNKKHYPMLESVVVPYQKA